MTHPFAWRSREASDIRHYWFSDIFLNKLCRLFFSGAADFAHHNDCLCLRIILEQTQAVDKVHAVDRIAADANTRALAEARLRGLEHSFIS